MTDLFRRREVLPEGRTNEEESKLIEGEKIKLGNPQLVIQQLESRYCFTILIYEPMVVLH